MARGSRDRRRAGRGAALAAALGLAVAAAGEPARAAPAQYELNYEIYASGIHGLTVAVTVADGGPAAPYATRLRARTEGIYDWFTSWRYRADSEGVRDGTTLRVARHRVASAFRGRTRRTTIEFHRDGAPAVTAEPPYVPGPDRHVPADALFGVVDPASALARLALVGAASCPATLPVYDGKRRYDMVLAARPAETLAATRYNPFAGEARRCHASFRKIAGFRADPDRRSIQDVELAIWLGRALAGRPAVPVRLEAQTPWGRLIGHLVRIVGADGALLYGAAE